MKNREAVPRLLDAVKVGIRYEHFVRLDAIDRHDFSLVRQKVAQESPGLDPEFLALGIHYLKRYYALQILDPLNPPAMSRPIDPFWHAHSLLTHQYIAFCNQVFGEYLHHVPLILHDKLACAFVAELYTKTVSRQEQVFGVIDERFIPRGPDAGMCCTPVDLGNPVIRAQALFPAEKVHLLKPNEFKTQRLEASEVLTG